MFVLARVAAPTVEAERNVGSSPVSEAVSGGCALQAAVLRSGHGARARRVTDDTRTGPETL